MVSLLQERAAQQLAAGSYHPWWNNQIVCVYIGNPRKTKKRIGRTTTITCCDTHVEYKVFERRNFYSPRTSQINHYTCLFIQYKLSRKSNITPETFCSFRRLAQSLLTLSSPSSSQTSRSLQRLGSFNLGMTTEGDLPWLSRFFFLS